MSLNFDFEKVENYEELDPVLKQGMVFNCLFIGMRGITEANAEEWYSRVTFYEKLFGPGRTEGPDKPIYTTPDEVRRCIGLTTNVSDETLASWRTRCVKQFMSDAKSAFKREPRSAPVSS